VFSCVDRAVAELHVVPRGAQRALPAGARAALSVANVGSLKRFQQHAPKPAFQPSPLKGATKSVEEGCLAICMRSLPPPYLRQLLLAQSAVRAVRCAAGTAPSQVAHGSLPGRARSMR
jgi:hypothetical protein